MDGAFIESQYIETFGVSDKEFEDNCRVDITDPAASFLPVRFKLASMITLQSFTEGFARRRACRGTPSPPKLHLH